ncbi:LOW QUALITY PROTEIN: serum response factor-binding protein 1 [Colossoma macropomum]|uniref:LOW QUALITY PROTEIN: serum response factor-binding protein 1 n=1 Tax=Colossoma macropomum TaxID=42526 RepID=UPI0018648C31|nr:LOW QUALITY PROTEIN: serum response factor-binding protein 1 [Colossoma macropomum]
MAAPAALNLSNEVVKMRAEVKRVKVLVIRKLTRQIAALKKKKGTEADLEKNQRRVARLLEEIRELKHLAPDSITKAALQKDISFEKVCQNKEASPSERATARVATHPQFSRRIQSIKKAIEAFKAERTGTAKADKKTQKESKGIIQQKSESEQDSDDEEDVEEAGKRNEKEQEGDDGPSQMTQKKDAEEKSTHADSVPVEVVRMRKEVKKLKVLIIRKLTQQITRLKKMKGEESELKGNRECAARLQKEVEVLRNVFPDDVTTSALQGNIDVEEVFQNPQSSPLERATARIATHACFIKKLQDVRDAIEKERTKAEKAEEKNKDAEETMADDSGDDGSNSDDEEEKEDEDEGEEGGTASDGSDDDDDDDNTGDNKKEMDEDQTLNVNKRSHVVKPPEDIRSATVVLSTKEKTPVTKLEAGVTEQAVPSASLKNIAKMPVSAGVVHSLPAKTTETPVKKPPSSKRDIKPETKKPENKEGEEESDLESSDEEEEKEYFDDSTEERFHKQSSLSEDSDEDDFFLGKVSKLKKKKSSGPGKDKTSEPKPAAEVQDAEEARGTSQDFKMQSVFCSTLSKSSGASQKGKPQGPKPPRFQNQKKYAERDGKPTWFKSQGPGTDRRPSAAGPKAPGQRQMGAAEARMGKPAFEQQRTQSYKGAPGKPFKPPQHSQQALHPSWEASKKRKEQQSQITAFQGKKIRFDDDD